jgi:hypothetical protein
MILQRMHDFVSLLLKKTHIAASSMSLISEPSYRAYSWARQSGFKNLTVVDIVSPEMLYLVDAYW